MENNPIHELDDLEDAIEAGGAWVLFLPTYAPDLNPIENCWSKGKAPAALAQAAHRGRTPGCLG
jgi:transposase